MNFGRNSPSGLPARPANDARSSLMCSGRWSPGAVGRIPYPQRVFIESWSRRIAELAPERAADDDRLRTLVIERELHLKGARARLANRNRLMDWSPGIGVGRMDFRWFRVRQFMIDLHRGFAA